MIPEDEIRLEQIVLHYENGGQFVPASNGGRNIIELACERMIALERVAENLAEEIVRLENRSVWAVFWHRFKAWFKYRKGQELRTVH